VVISKHSPESELLLFCDVLGRNVGHSSSLRSFFLNFHDWDYWRKTSGFFFFLHEFQHIEKNPRLTVSIIPSLAVLTMLAEFYFHVVLSLWYVNGPRIIRATVFLNLYSLSNNETPRMFIKL